MRATAFLVFLAIAGGVTFYIWEHNRAVDVAAAANNGAICEINIQLADDLYQQFASGDVNGAILGNVETTQEGANTTTDLSVTTTSSELLTELRQVIAELSVIADVNCTPVVSKLPPMTPGRIIIDLHFFRPYPAGQEPQ